MYSSLLDWLHFFAYLEASERWKLFSGRILDQTLQFSPSFEKLFPLPSFFLPKKTYGLKLLEHFLPLFSAFWHWLILVIGTPTNSSREKSKQEIFFLREIRWNVTSCKLLSANELVCRAASFPLFHFQCPSHSPRLRKFFPPSPDPGNESSSFAFRVIFSFSIWLSEAQRLHSELGKRKTYFRGLMGFVFQMISLFQ